MVGGDFGGVGRGWGGVGGSLQRAQGVGVRREQGGHQMIKDLCPLDHLDDDDDDDGRRHHQPDSD